VYTASSFSFSRPIGISLVSPQYYKQHNVSLRHQTGLHSGRTLADILGLPGSNIEGIACFPVDVRASAYLFQSNVG
jgi:hypothetical protein